MTPDKKCSQQACATIILCLVIFLSPPKIINFAIVLYLVVLIPTFWAESITDVILTSFSDG